MQQWHHTSALMCLLANVNIGPDDTPFTAADFHPHIQQPNTPGDESDDIAFLESHGF